MGEVSRSILPLAQHSNGAGDVAGAGTPGAATPWFTTAITIPNECMRVALNVATSGATIVSYKRNGGTAVPINNGAALTAGAAFACMIGVRPGDTFNLQDSAGSTVVDLTVDGVHGSY